MARIRRVVACGEGVPEPSLVCTMMVHFSCLGVAEHITRSVSVNVPRVQGVKHQRNRAIRCTAVDSPTPWAPLMPNKLVPCRPNACRGKRQILAAQYSVQDGSPSCHSCQSCQSA
jgi:hypothetical protein